MDRVTARPQVGDRPIVFLLPSIDVGGTERHMITLANGFAARGCAVEICTFCTIDGALRGDIDPMVGVATLGLRRARNFPKPLRRYLRRVRPQVVVCAMHLAATLGILARLFRFTDAAIVVFEGGFANAMPGSLVDRASRAVRTRMLFRHATLIVTNAQGIADQIARTAHIPRDKIAILPNPIAEDVFQAQCFDASDNTSWPARYPTVCAVARLNANKDIGSILKAVAALRPTRLLSLVVIGDGPERNDLEDMADMLGIGEDVHFLGWQRHPWHLVERSAVFVQASRTEGYSNALIEALAVGCPVVATDAPGATRSLLEADGTGLLVPVGDVTAMAEAICQIIDRPRSSAMLIAKARALTAPAMDAWFATIRNAARSQQPG